MSIVIQDFQDTPVKLYSPVGELIGEIKSAASFAHVRCQIAEQELEGYYIIFNEEKIFIKSNGGCYDNPKGLFDTEMNFVTIRFGINLRKRQAENKEVFYVAK